jgi:hypothetical protein
MSDFTDYIEEKLFSDEARDKVVVALNENINIPFINEKTEAKVLGALWAVVVDVLKQILRK